MALEGNIKEFGVTDILQLISQQQKTGTLTVERKDQKVEISFFEGKIAGTRPASRSDRDTLGEMLVRAKLVTPKNIKKALAIQQQSLEYLGEILIKQGFIKKQDLERALLTQSYETFYDIFQWQEGSYQFHPTAVNINASLSPLLSLDSILLDVLRMIDEWPDVKKTITSFDLVFQQIPGTGRENLLQDESLVLSLADGRHTARQIIDQSLLGRFNTSKILADLLKGGYIQHVSSSKVAAKKTLTKISHQKLAASLSYGGLGLVLCVLLLLPSASLNNFLLIPQLKGLRLLSLRQYQDNKVLLKLEKALGMYLIRNGEYPKSLVELSSSGILSADELALHGQGIIHYRAKGDSYTIKIAREG